MKVSYNWLQTYFEKKLPSAHIIAETLTFHAFEVESVEEKDNDCILDIDILPNRASDCFSHIGIAREISILTGIPMKEEIPIILETPHPNGISVKVEEDKLCRRYIGKVIDGVHVADSPKWLRECLESIGQKSINNIVDATNFLMFGIGQPLHAFDLDKIDGDEIIVRKAKRGENIITLDGEKTELCEEDIVIADEKGPIAIAGVKGGKMAEIDRYTKRIVIESANFDPVSVRKTSRRLGIITESSKRFENNIPPKLAEEAIEKLTLLIRGMEWNEHVHIGESMDFYPRQAGVYKVGISAEEVNKVLGIQLAGKDIENILKKLAFDYEKVDDPIKKVLELAPKYEGVPYKYGASITYDAPRYFDCSSLVSFLFAQAGVDIPRMTADQYIFANQVCEKDLIAGDIVFSNTQEGTLHYQTKEFLPETNIPEGVDHCGIYLGDGRVIHASRHNGDGIEIQNLKKSRQFEHIVGIGRIEISAPRFVVSVPYWRSDVRIKENIIEEIGRVYGYKNIASKIPKIEFKPAINKHFYYANKIRSILSQEGFSEVYNYSFSKKGEIELQNPLDKTKSFLRANLSDGIKESLKKNAYHMPLLGLYEIKIFEIGKVFTKDNEYTSFAIGVLVSGKNADVRIESIMRNISNILSDALGVAVGGDIKDGIFEISFDSLVDNLLDVENDSVIAETAYTDIKYENISPYPFVLRDIAIWAPSTTSEKEVLSVIKESAGNLLVQSKLFDVFEKDERVSYAFNLVFQSHEKTLTDEEVNAVMGLIKNTLEELNWEVR